MNTSTTTKTVYNASFEKEELEKFLDELKELFSNCYSSDNGYNTNKTPYAYLENNEPHVAAFYSAMRGMI